MKSFKTKYNLHLLIISFIIFISASLYISCQNESDKNEESIVKKDVPKLLSDQVFTGEESCKSCHEAEFANWKTSHHFKAMLKPDSTSVLGDFDDVSFTNEDGMKTRFYKKDNEYWVNTMNGDGANQDYKIIYTFGYTPLQQYIVEYPKGKFQCLSTAWDSEQNKWFDLYQGMHVVHTEWLHQSKGAMNWNTMCADCHSTNVRKNFDEQTGSFNTEYSIINVSCEACHGPGKEHVKQMKENPNQKNVESTFQMTKSITPHEQVDQCARCHMRREQYSLAYNHEGTMMDHYFPQLLTEGMYHADGQILDEVYVYGSFTQSKMYMNNVKCTDCHEPHSMELKAVGNALCAQCHVPEQYDTELHTFHTKDSEGSQCVNCHMTGNTYMVNDYRRDHSFRIPRPDLSIKYGTPNACTQCHTDKTEEWAWNNYKEWYGEVDSTYYTDVLAMARNAEPGGKEALLNLVANDQYSPMVRGTAVNYLGNYLDQESLNKLFSYLKDKEPIVRGASIDLLKNLSLDNNALSSMYPLLADEKRSIRVKAFDALAGIPKQNIPEQYKTAYDQAREEYFDHLDVIADFTGGQAKKARYYERTNQIAKAIQAYENAIEIDNYNNMARNNLANLYYQQQQFDKAEKLFRKIIEQEPEFGQTYYSLGLMLAEMQRYDEAIPELKKAIQYIPENIRVRYNLGLIYQTTGQYNKAVNTFQEGLLIDPQNEGLLYALFYFYTSVKPDKAEARRYINELVKYYPENQNYRQMAAGVQ